MDNKSNGKLAALAVGGAVLMGASFFGLSFLTGYKLPADTLSPFLTPLRSFAGWISLILFASLVIMGLGKMSARISDKWFLSFPLSIIAIVALMFVSLWLRPSGLLRSTTGRTTTLDGKYIRSIAELKAYLEKPVLSPGVPLAPPGFNFKAAQDLWTAKCNICHTQLSTMDALKSKYKKKGKIDIVVKSMEAKAGGMITPADALTIEQFLNQGTIP
ncbi:MAG: photosystem P840 reaction-center cytochrome c-551 [Chlorobiaceae bacterium]